MSTLNEMFLKYIPKEEIKDEIQMVMPTENEDYDTLYEQIGEIVVKTRAKRVMTRAELARKTGLNPLSLIRIETGRGNVTVKSLYRIDKALDVDLKISFVPKRKA